MENVKNNNYLGTEKISQLMIKFSVPCVLSLMIGALYNIVDQIFIGNSELSTLGNAATGVVFPIFILGQAFAWTLSSGCATYLNICQGRQDSEGIHRAVGTCATAGLIISILLVAFIFPLRTPILLFFGASSANLPLAEEYLNIILAFYPTYIFANMTMGTISADGSPTYAMFMLLSGAIANLILDPIFIFVFKWGMSGAAYATVAGQILSCAVAIAYFCRPKTFKLRKESFIPDLKIFPSIIRYGSSTFVAQTTLLLVTVICNTTLVKYGSISHYGPDIPIAVYGIACKFFTIVMEIVVGVALGCQPVISYNIGAEKYDRVKELYNKILFCTLFIGIFFTLLFQLAPEFVIGLFGEPTNIPNPEDYWIFAEKTFRIHLMLISFTALVKMYSIFFQASGKPLYALIASVVRDVVCFVPLVFILPAVYGIEGMLFAAPVSDFVAMATVLYLSVKFWKSMK